MDWAPREGSRAVLETPIVSVAESKDAAVDEEGGRGKDVKQETLEYARAKKLTARNPRLFSRKAAELSSTWGKAKKPGNAPIPSPPY